MRFLAPLLALTLAAPVYGCAVQASPASTLGGSEWQFLSIDGEAAVSQKAKLTFADEKLGANVGCNGISGPWRIEHGRLFAGPLAQTEMYCEGPVWNQEEAASALLVAAPEFSLDGNRLMLRSRGHFAELERIDAPHQQP